MKDFDRFFQKIYEQPLANRRDWYADSTVAYAQYRAPYVPEIIDFVCEQLPDSSNTQLLEIGSGPGNATQHFLAKGYGMTCIEPNTTACEFVQHRFRDYPNLQIINSTLEEWGDFSTQYDGAIASTSFHWLNPETRCQQVAQRLKPDSKLVLLWNTAPQPDPEIYQYLQPIYAEYMPTFADYENLKTQENNILKVSDSLIESGYFYQIEKKKTIAQRLYKNEEYLALLTTLSPYIALSEEVRISFFDALRNVLTTHKITEISTQYISAAHIATKQQ